MGPNMSENLEKLAKTSKNFAKTSKKFAKIFAKLVSDWFSDWGGITMYACCKIEQACDSTKCKANQWQIEGRSIHGSK